MAWSTPKTYSAAAATSAEMNTYVRDNMNALRTAQRITVAVKTTDTTFSTTAATVCSFSYTFDSATTYLVTGTCYQWVSSVAATVNGHLSVVVNGVTYAAQRSKSNGTAAGQSGISAAGIISGLSGTHTVTLQAYADTGSGHGITSPTTAPAVLTLTPIDVV